MKLFYVANARIPTEKAHGIAIMKACQAFVRAGVELTLVIPERDNPNPADPHEFYAIPERFPILRLPTFDLMRSSWVPQRVSYVLQTWAFNRSLRAWARSQDKNAVIYTREVSALALCKMGFRTVLECHMISGSRRRYFQRARRANVIITVSHTIEKLFLEVGFSSKQLLVCPNAADLAVFDTALSKQDARREVDLPQDAFITVYTGNFTTMGEDKGIADSIRALKHAEDIFFVGVGGSEKDIVRYEMQAKEAGVGERVILRGHVQQSKLAVYQKAADVLLMPFPDTPYYRTQMSPIKMFEYMLSGRPIIASDLPTIREVLDPTVARIVAPDSPELLAEAIESLRRDPASGARLAEAAHKKAAGSYTWDMRALSILSFIKTTVVS